MPVLKKSFILSKIQSPAVLRHMDQYISEFIRSPVLQMYYFSLNPADKADVRV